MVSPESCPACGATRYKKTGHPRHGPQPHWGKTCERPFRAGAKPQRIASERRAEIAHLLRERLSRRGICRAVSGSLTWLLHCMVACFAPCPEHLQGRLPPGPANVLLAKFEAEADAMGSFVQKKANKQWLWLAMDATTRQIMAFHVGDRSRERAKAVWGALPEVYQAHATWHTDQYDVYNGVIPTERPKAIPKKARTTNHIARCNNTLRQRLARLVRAPLSFSKKVENHIGAIQFFLCHYNQEQAAALPL